MNRPSLIASIILGIAALAFVVVAALAILWRAHGFNPDFLEIDACLDRGGRWDYQARICLP